MLDLSGFVSPATTFEGLDNLTNTLIRNRQEKAHLRQQKEAKAAASTKFFANYLDDKEKFTGTKYDPINHELISKAMNDAMELVQQGANDSDILTAISKDVNKAAKYTMAAQTYAANKKAYIDNLQKGGAKGIDLEKLSSEIDKQAFPEGVDVATVDPTVNYGDMALKNGDVYNTEAFDDAFTKAPKNTEVGTVKYTNKKGGIQRDKVKLTSPYYAISEKDADGNHIGFVPKYQVAQDEGNEIIHQFETENGKVDAPIRLYDKDLFNNLSAGEQGHLLQETRKFANQKGVHLSSVQAENFARALAYDEKKSRINGTYEHVEETKENPAPRISIHVGGKPTQGELKAAQSASDLKIALDSEEVNADGKINVSNYINGVTFLTNAKGKRISQPEIFFDPKDKTFTYTDDEGKTETASFAKFKSIATPVNTASDLGFLEGFRSYKRSGDKKEEPKAPEPPKKKSFFDKLTDQSLWNKKDKSSGSKWDKYKAN